jgi:pimeloyl-ACP methyl ester carboxylesterase
VAHVVLYDLRGCGRSSRTPPVGSLPVEALQPDQLADDTAALIRHLGAEQAGVLGFSYGGMVAMRVAEQHPHVLRRLILASTTAYRDFSDELAADPDFVERGALCTPVDFADPALTGPEAPDGALIRAMAVGSAARDVWQLDRLGQWHEVLERVRFSSDWNEPYTAGTLRRPAPDDPAAALRGWGGPVLLLQGAREMSFPIAVARRLHAALPGSRLVEQPHPAFVDLARRVARHRDAIEVSITHGLSNALVESVNTKLRLITRIAFGFHDPHALIGLAMLALGGLCPPLPSRTRPPHQTQHSNPPDYSNSQG